MIKCSQCNSLPSENDVIGWKCNSCGKVFKVSKLQLHNIIKKKDISPERSYVNCPTCKNILDDGNENIVWKCSCGNINKGKLKEYEEEKEVGQEILPKSNLVKCSECGKEISSKAKRCVHCGKILIEDVFPKKFCGDCGQAVPINALECPYCGCPIEDDKEEYASKSENSKRKNIKRFIISIIGIVVIASMAVLIINFIGSNLNEDEQLAYQNAVEMKSMMRDPDSFRLYDEMFILKHYDDDGSVEYTYTIFKYGGANGYGAITTDEAIFRDGEYIMDYADEPDEDDRDYMEQLMVKADLALYMISGGGDDWEMIDIDIEKIKKKMGIE